MNAPVTCSTCEGRGYHIVNVRGLHNGVAADIVRCDRCDGSGAVRPKDSVSPVQETRAASDN